MRFDECARTRPTSVRDEDPRGCWSPEAESAKAREIAQAAGFTYIQAPYIAEVARTKGSRSS